MTRNSLTLITLFLSIGSLAQAMPVYELEPYVVVAPNIWAPDATLHKDSIESAKPVDLAAILSAELPAAALTRKGPLAGDIVLRGFSRDNVVITVDNNKTFCACPNRMDPPAFHVSSQQIEGIRVRTGPFSVDQGGSIGGTVAVRTTAPSPQSSARIYGYYGSYDYFAAGITGNVYVSEDVSLLGGLYKQQGDVYKDGDGVRFTETTNYLPQYVDTKAFDVYTAEVKATYLLENNATVLVNYAYQDASNVLYPGLGMDAPSDTMNRASVAYRTPVDLSFADDVDISLAFSHVDHDMTDAFRTSMLPFAARGYMMRTEATSAFVGARTELSKTIDSDALIRFGADLKRRYWDANNIVMNSRNDMLPDTINDTFGLWGVYEQRKERWAFEGGFRMDISRSKAREDISFVQGIHGTTTNEQHDILPSLYGLVSHDIDKHFSIHAGAGFASRMPDPQERYMNLNRPMAKPDWAGNPDLNPVRNFEVQTGLRWENETANAQLNLFHSWLSDTIYLAKLPGATSYENIDARIYGISANAGWNIAKPIRIEAGLAWQEGVKESLPTNATNDVLGEIPPMRGRLAALLNYNELSIKAEGQWQSRLDRIDPDLNEAELGGWAVLNLAASYQFSDAISMSVGVDNVFDKKYAVANSFVRDPFRTGNIVNEPGRFLFVRIGIEL